MAAKKGGVVGQSDAVLLELLQEKHRLEEEIAAKDQEVKKHEAEYASRKNKVVEDQKQGQAECKRFSDQLSADQIRIKADQEQLERLRTDYDRLLRDVAAAEQAKERVRTELQLEEDAARLEIERRRKELELERLQKATEAAGVKAARAGELEQAAERYREELRLLREREARQKELLQGLQAASVGWQGLLEKKKREQQLKQQELGKLQTQLTAVQQHVASLQSASTALQAQHTQEHAALTAEAECRQELQLEVEAAQASCAKLQATVTTLNSQSDRLEIQRRQLVDRLKSESDEQLRLQREGEVFMGGLDRVNADYKQEDHRVAFMLVPEEAKVSKAIRQLDSARKDLQDSHRLQRDFLRTQRDGLLRTKQTAPKPDFNLDTRYSEPRPNPVPKQPSTDKAPALKEQLTARQTTLEQLRTQVNGLSARLVERRKGVARTVDAKTHRGGAERQMRNVLVCVGVVVGVLLEFWLQ